MHNVYRTCDKFKLALYLLRTKLICRTVRLFRFPIDIRGKKYIDFGNNLTSGTHCRLEAFHIGEEEINSHKIIFGDNVQINDFVHISSISSVKIGDNVLIASHVYISDNSHGFYKGDENDSSPETPPTSREYYVSSVSIGNNVWIGEGVIIMPGVTIGNGSIIGAHSVVNRNIPENCIAVGSPARVIKRFNKHNGHWEEA